MSAPADTGAPAAMDPRLPPGPTLPRPVTGLLFTVARRQTMDALTRRYGAAFTIDSPLFGPSVVVTEPDLARQVFLADADTLGNIQPNLSRVLGSGSVFALDGAAHRRRRNLLSPPFHGKQVRSYQPLFVEETLREIADWPTGVALPTLPAMMRITLNAILRAVFGAAGADLDRLRRIIPPWVTLGSRLTALPLPARSYARFSPWGRLAAYQRQYLQVLDTLIDTARADPGFAERTDILSVLLRSHCDDGSVLTRKEIGDELMTLLAAGHETTAATLAWVFERLSREPYWLAQLTEEADTDEHLLRRAVIREVQRTRTVIDFAGRHVYAPAFALGDWTVPRGHSVLVALRQIHANPAAFADPQRFDPHRYLDANPSAFEWVAFGGGTRRCPGSAFATLEMDLVLRTVLRHFTIEPTTEPGERWHARGVAFTPARGGRIVVRRR